MVENKNDESFLARIKQLEHERDELRKDIEQLCIQQAGPSYLAVATRMHFQRTAGLEQEIESLKKKLATLHWKRPKSAEAGGEARGAFQTKWSKLDPVRQTIRRCRPRWTFQTWLGLQCPKRKWDKTNPHTWRHDSQSNGWRESK